MGRPKDPIWRHFPGAQTMAPPARTPVVRCPRCDQNVPAAATSLKTHYTSTCTRRVLSVGQLPAALPVRHEPLPAALPVRHHVRDPAPLHVRLSTADPAQLPTQLPGHLHQHHVAQQSAAYLAVSLDGDLDSYDSDSGVDESLDAVHDFAYPADRHREPVDPRPAKRACPRVQQQLTAQSGFHVDYMPTDERKRLQILLARAMHANRCPFSLFDCELFREFFAGLRKVFILPPPDKIGGQLLVDCYAADMDIVRADLAMCTAGTITMDGATNVHGRSTMNVMVCTPQPYFVETATSGINRESSRYVAELIESAAR